MSVSIKLPDGSEKIFPDPPSGLDLAKSIGPRLVKDAVGFMVQGHGEIQDIRSVLKSGDQVRIVARPSKEALEVIRHSAAHVLAQAVQNLWPEVKVTIGPVIENGFYYDFDTHKTFTPEDLNAIEKEMKKIIKAGFKVTREVWSSEKAIKYFEEKGESLKKEIIQDLNEKEVSIYRQGDWLDLCKGPHVQNLSQIGAIKVLSHSGAYWRGDSKNKQLQRIYGTAFHSEKELKVYLKQQEEAARNDHRLLGKKLDLFWFNELSAGNPFFTPSGTKIYQTLQTFLREKYKEYEYEEVITPQIFNSELFKRSGHIKHFTENMFSVIESENNQPDTKENAQQGVKLLKLSVWETLKKNPGIGPSTVSEKTGLPRQLKNQTGQNDRLAQWFLEYLKSEDLADNRERGKWQALDKKIAPQTRKESESNSQNFLLKPMNCPGHCLLYKKDRKSYRDLPWRVADFGRLHRREPAGALQGLTRVKSFCQDDAHIFCRPDQLLEEMQKGLQMLQDIYQTLGLNDYEIALSTRPASRMGNEALWDQAEKALKESLKNLNIPFREQPGEGAFYGPKLDINIKDSFSRSWQMGTFQCDFNLPRAFDLSYTNERGEEDCPVMVHRAILGSLERFMGVYLEHRKGRLPLWLCPTQVIILPLTDREGDFCRKIQIKLAQEGIICKIDRRNEKISYKIREAQLLQIPYMMVIGKKETESGNISLRLREGIQFNDLPLKTFQNTVLEEIHKKSLHSLFSKKQG